MDYLPGLCQGISRVLISHPFDYIRIYLQTNKSPNYLDFFKKNSIYTLYRGVGIPLVTVPVDRAIQFRIYEHLNKKKISPFLSGSLCGMVGIIFTLPSSFICNNYILNKKENNLTNFTKHRFKNPRQLYNGFKPEFIRSVLGSTIYLGIYGKMRGKYGNSVKQSTINGAVAGWTVWTVTYPFETIKVEQQLNNRKMYDILKYRILKYGIFNMWKGIAPVYIRTIPSSMVGMGVYEKVKNIIHNG